MTGPFKIENGKVKLENGTILPYCGVKDVLKVDDMLVLLLSLESPDNIGQEGRNVVAVDPSGRELWRIEDPKEQLPSSRPFANMFLENGVLRVGNWSGGEYKVDPQTGRVEFLYWSR